MVIVSILLLVLSGRLSYSVNRLLQRATGEMETASRSSCKSIPGLAALTNACILFS